LPYFACHDVVALIVIQPFAIGLLNSYLYYAFNNESRIAKFQGIICHRSFVEIKMLGLRYVAGAIPGLHWTFGPVKVKLLLDQITFYWTKKI
jgi:hypothetical protein